MAWVRIHDGAITHPKVIGLTDKAFRLWVWGLSYSQQHLTDGLLLVEALPPRLKRAATDLIEKRLWEPHDVGYKVHDYLDWNDSREVVLSKRSDAKVRMSNARERSRDHTERTSREVLRRVGLDQDLLLHKEEEIDPFDAFWTVYPRKVGKDAARRAWDKRRINADLASTVIAALAWQVQQDNWLREGGRFVPNPATWINQGRWQDEPQTTPQISDSTLAMARATEEFLRS